MLAVLLLCACAAAIYIRRFGSSERPLMWVSFVAHQVAGVLSIWVNKYYYGYGDMLAYHEFGVVAAGRLRADFWQLAPGLLRLLVHSSEPLPIPMETLTSSSGAIQAISAFSSYLLFDSLYATCALIAGLAFLSKVALYSVTCEELPHLPRRPLLCVCTLLPSAVFWSCSLLKEPIAMIGLLSIIYGWQQLTHARNRLQGLVLTAGGALTVFAVKAYILPALVVSLAAWRLARKIHEGRGDVTFKAGHAIIIAASAVLLVSVTGALLPQFAPEALSDQLAGLQTVGAVVEGGSNFALGRGAGSPGSQAALAPLGLATALFRPMLFDITAPIVIPSALEMTIFLLAAILALVRRGVLASLSELIRRPFLSFCAVFVLIFGTLVGLGTTNMGALSRYRMPLTPFFATLLIALIARDPVASREATRKELVRL